METYTIEKTIFIGVPVNVVFEALTNSSKIIQYYPLTEVICDWQVGSEIICKGTNDGKDFTDYGKIDILIPNQQFQYTYWSDNHGTEKTPENHLTICYTLDEVENGTIVKLKHSNLKSEAMYLQMMDVWDFLLNSFQNFLEN